jgi:hypothetical protein
MGNENIKTVNIFRLFRNVYFRKDEYHTAFKSLVTLY